MLGILVLIFQDARLEGLLGYTSQGGRASTQVLFLFAVVFGLSTDCGVFLLSRIKEARDGGYSDAEAVAFGLERTGRIVTAAALLFSIAIGAFVTSQLVFIKELGLGTATEPTAGGVRCSANARCARSRPEPLRRPRVGHTVATRPSTSGAFFRSPPAGRTQR